MPETTSYPLPSTYRDVLDFLGSHLGPRDSYLRNLRDFWTERSYLTDAQVSAARRIMLERGYTVLEVPSGAPDPVDPFNIPAVRNDTPATADDVPTIFNGTYTIDDGVEHVTYRIHTVIRGSLAGQRIIKRQTRYGEFEGFAFLTADGRMRLWRRFENDRDALYVRWADRLITMLDGTVWDGDVISVTWPEPGHPDDAIVVHRWAINRTRACRRCNRPLTNPTSIESGIGPECASRTADENRTTAAPHFERLDDDYTLSSTPAPEPVRRVRRTPRTPAATPAPQPVMSELTPDWEQ